MSRFKPAANAYAARIASVQRRGKPYTESDISEAYEVGALRSCLFTPPAPAVPSQPSLREAKLVEALKKADKWIESVVGHDVRLSAFEIRRTIHEVLAAHQPSGKGE